MGKPKVIELPTGLAIPILYEDRSVLVIDKPAGWLCAPSSWEQTSRNLQRALESGINGGDFWARSRNLKYLRFVHRLDADTSGVLVLAKSAGALSALGGLFEERAVEKMYFAVARGTPKETEWTCRAKLSSVEGQAGMICVDEQNGQDAETQFRILETKGDVSLIEARPLTGRTHQIRVHLAASGFWILNDSIYGAPGAIPSRKPGRDDEDRPTLALRAVRVTYADPFQRRRIVIEAPTENWLKHFGFAPRPRQPRVNPGTLHGAPASGPAGRDKS